jgi:predicted RNA-binding protein (virulence factor B family)
MDAIPGEFNDLEMIKSTDFGIYLDGGEMGEILMPLKYLKGGEQPGDKIRCFVYYDTEDRPIATAELPKAVVGECAWLECVAVTKFGAFMNWGLTKDLLIPFREQLNEIVLGQSYPVFIYLDILTRRIVGSTKIEKYLNRRKPEFTAFQEVILMIAYSSDMGFTAVINNSHTGLIYRNEVFQPIKGGDKLKGYIKEIRGDGKIDLTLKLPGYDNLIGDDKIVLDIIKKHGGSMSITDKSDPEEIYSLFHMSKKNWKKVIGNLYRKRKIQITEKDIFILNDGD